MNLTTVSLRKYCSVFTNWFNAIPPGTFLFPNRSDISTVFLWYLWIDSFFICFNVLMFVLVIFVFPLVFSIKWIYFFDNVMKICLVIPVFFFFFFSWKNIFWIFVVRICYDLRFTREGLPRDVHQVCLGRFGKRFQNMKNVSLHIYMSLFSK